MKRKANKIIVHLTDDDFDYDRVLAEIDADKKKYQEIHDEENANVAWIIKHIVIAHKSFVETYSLLKLKEYYKAWCELEQIELLCNRIVKLCPGAIEALCYIMDTVRNIQLLYPYRLFTSTVMVVKERECSICGKKRSIRNHCGHFVGYLYNGHLCYDTIKSIDLKGIDIVFNPEHKYAVLGADGSIEYDFSAVENLMNWWPKPFCGWHMEPEILYLNPETFPDLADEGLCPCGSMKLYAECCKGNPKGIKHTRYNLLCGYTKYK